MPAEAEHDYVADGSKKRQFEVTRVPYGDVYSCGGSVRCSHQALIRL